MEDTAFEFNDTGTVVIDPQMEKKPKMKKKTTSLTLDEKDLLRVEMIKEHSDCKTQNQIIKRAIALYHFLVEQQFEQGRIFLTANRDGKGAERLHLI